MHISIQQPLNFLAVKFHTYNFYLLGDKGGFMRPCNNFPSVKFVWDNNKLTNQVICSYDRLFFFIINRLYSATDMTWYTWYNIKCNEHNYTDVVALKVAGNLYQPLTNYLWYILLLNYYLTTL